MIISDRHTYLDTGVPYLNGARFEEMYIMEYSFAVVADKRDYIPTLPDLMNLAIVSLCVINEYQE